MHYSVRFFVFTSNVYLILSEKILPSCKEAPAIFQCNNNIRELRMTLSVSLIVCKDFSVFSIGIIVIVGYFYRGPDINIDINWNYPP